MKELTQNDINKMVSKAYRNLATFRKEAIKFPVPRNNSMSVIVEQGTLQGEVYLDYVRYENYDLRIFNSPGEAKTHIEELDQSKNYTVTSLSFVSK